MSDKQELLAAFKRAGIKYKNQKKSLKSVMNGRLQPDGFIFNSILEINQGVGIEGCQTIFYFLDGKLVGHGSWTNRMKV